MASFSFGAGNAGKLLRAPLYVLGRLATAVIPRTGRDWVFGSAVGIADGALALWREAVERHGEHGVWLVATPEESQQAEERGMRWAHKGSLRGFWLTARAPVIVITHGFGDVNRYAATSGIIVQLWHGIPLKRIGLDTAVTTRSPLPVLGGTVSAALAWLYRRTQRRIRILPAASEGVRGRLESAFGLPSSRVPVTGEPRVDVLSIGTAAERRQRARADLAEHVGPLPQRVVLYAPTWRDGAPDPVVFSARELDELRTLCEQNDAVVLVRSHPLGQSQWPLSERVRALGSDRVADVTPLLPGMDLLITDYSSLVYDAALVPLPTIFLAPDLEEYERTRGFYGRYRDVAHDVVTDAEALLEELGRVLSEEEERDRRVAFAENLSRRHHRFADGGNTARVYRAVMAERAARGRTT